MNAMFGFSKSGLARSKCFPDNISMETITESRERRCKRLVSVEASEGWIRWLDDLAGAAGTNRSATIDQALRLYAKHIRHGARPPRR